MKSIFTLLIITLGATIARAQFYQPELELKKATSVKIDSKSEYFLGITNSEGETVFYGKGNAWGTRASAKMDVSEALSVRFTPITQIVNGVEVQCITISNYISNKYGWDAHLDIDDGDHKAPNNGNQSWVDGQGRRGDGFWQLTDLGNGQIELNNILAPGTKFGITKSLAIWSADDYDYILSTSDEGGNWDNRLYHIGWAAPKVAVLDDMDEETGDSVAAYIWGDENYTTWQAYDATIYNMKMKFYNWWNDKDKDGKQGSYYYYMDPTVKDACDRAQEVYDDPSTTAEQLQNAYNEIMKVVGWIEVQKNTKLLDNATIDEPIDLFKKGIALNANYDDGTLDGWTANLKGNDNHVQRDNLSNGSISISGFAESWTWNAQHSGDGDFTQKVALPEGFYQLEVDMIATRQSGSKADSKGVELFVMNIDESEEFSIPVSTGNNAPEHFSLGFKTMGGLFIIGVREIGPTVNWIAIDNWKLKYYGKTSYTYAQIALRYKVQTIDKEYKSLSVYGNSEVISNYHNVYDKVAVLANAANLSDVDCQMWSDSLQSAMNALKASIDDYVVFAQRMDEVWSKSMEMKNINSSCSEDLYGYFHELFVAYKACEWTRQEIDMIYSDLASILGRYIDEVQPGNDISYLLNNPKLSQGGDGWSIEGVSPYWHVNDFYGENANAGYCQEVPAEDDGLVESYHAKFDLYQVIYNLPAGLYTLSVQGFNRHDDGHDESAQIYATFLDGSEQVQDFADISDYKTPRRLYVKNNVDGNPEWSSDAGREDDTYWVPNSTTGAAWHFCNKSDGKNYDYTNTFSIHMKEQGNLRVGVRCRNSHQWAVFDNFTLIYEGPGSTAWLPTLVDEMERLNTKMSNADITNGEKNAIRVIIGQADSFIKDINSHSENECLVQLALLRDQYAEITKNPELVAQIKAFCEIMNDKEKQADAAEDALKKRFYEAEYAASGSLNGLNNVELVALIEEIKTVLTLIRMPKDWESASGENPADFSAMIINRFFNPDGSEDPEKEPVPVHNHMFTEWQGKQPGTGGGVPGNCAEFWNSGAFDSYQELSGLPSGTYVLGCQGYLRHGGGSVDSYAILNGEKEQQVFAYLYANSSEGKYSTELCNIASVQLDQLTLNSLGIDVTPGYSSFGNLYKAPDQLATADNFFKAGFYKNEVIVEVGEDGILRVGIEKVGSVGQDDVVVDNFSLFYFGSRASTVASLTIEDSKAFNNVTEKEIETLTYTRNFKNTNWQPLYVPFSMSCEDWASQGLEVARLNGFYEYDDNLDGKIDRSALEVLKVTATEGNLKPNHPYMVRATTTGEKSVVVKNVTLYPTVENSGDCSTFETKYTFTGTYCAIANAELTAMGAYVMGGGALGQSTSNLNPMRWYMVRESRGGQLLPTLKSIKVYVYGEDEADAIDFTYDNEAEGEAYNLMGQKVSNSQKGIVIRNGKKFVNK